MKTIINNHIANIRIKRNREKFYAILELEGKTLGISEHFHTQAAATMAGELMAKRYKNNPELVSIF